MKEINIEFKKSDKSEVALLMTVYIKTNASWLNDALESIYNQTLKPNELILVADGMLTESHYNVIDKWKELFGHGFHLLQLEANVGLPKALNIGLNKCRSNLVARMDADDVMVPDRLEKQVSFFKYNSVDVVGSWLEEFDENMKISLGLRKVEKTHEEITAFAKWRCPMNHMSVMYKKEAVANVGGYNEKMKRSQDYVLWCTLIKEGYVFANIQEPLIKARTSKDFYRKRNNASVIKYDFKLRKHMYDIGFVNVFEFGLGLIFRITIRIVPQRIVKKIYQNLRHN